MGLDTLTNGISTAIKNNPLGVAVGTAGVGVAAGLGAAAVVGAVKRRKSKRFKTRTSRKRSNKGRKLKFGSKAYRKKYLGKRRRHSKRTSHRKIRLTKKGQPYIIRSDGKARFISKKSARISRHRKGGRY